jgi:DnaJ-class molecular chaperone
MDTHVHAVSFAESGESTAEEVECKRCYGTGEDRDGADCVPCEGYGTVLV